MPNSRRQFLAGSIGGLIASATPFQTGTFSKYDAQAKTVLSKMTLDEKIGQMTQPDNKYLDSIDDIDEYHVGSVLSGGDSDPQAGNDLKSWTQMVESYQKRAIKTRLAIPLLYGIDAVHGHNNLIGATIFPHNVGLGCTRDPSLLEKAARVTAEEVRASAINWAFAPCVTVPQDIRWGRTYEGYSESSDVVKVLGEAAVRGLQKGTALDDPLAVLACAKHFAGDGGTTFGTGMPKSPTERYPLDRGDTRVDEATLREVHLPGYVTTVQAGVGSIMPSYSSWNGEKCSGNKRLLQGILKDSLDFEGFLISDYNALDELPGNYAEQVERSINAGMDMVMVPDKYKTFFNTMRALVQNGRIEQARIDDAVTRILRVKFAMGLMDPKRSHMGHGAMQKSFGSAEHRAVARECVQKSVVVLKNQNKALPLGKSGGRIHVAGRGANDVGLQCGGWTISWQGKSGSEQKGTTILAALRNTVSKSTQLTYSVDGSGAAGARVGLVVIGESPYAEFFGDRQDLNLATEDVATVERVKAAGIPVVVVLLSGRPMILDPILDKADAIVAAWLPGSEGEGVTSVLLGDQRPTGKLSFTWPRGDSTSLHRGDAGYKTLYAFGHGLDY